MPGWGRSPGGGHGNPLQYSCLENPRGQKSLVGYRPCSHRVGHDWSDPAHTRLYVTYILYREWLLVLSDIKQSGEEGENVKLAAVF